MNPLLPDLNPWAILVAGAAYWIVGSLWFSMIAGSAWAAELEKLGIHIKEPNKKELATKMVITFLLNILVATGVSLVIEQFNVQSILHAMVTGVMLGIGFSASVIGIAYTWESRPLKLFLIDAAYPVIGITICSIILTLWR